MKALDGGRIGIASQSLGIARASLDALIRWIAESKSRQHTQHLQASLANLETQWSVAKNLTLKAAFLKSKQQPFGFAAAQAKCYASEMANTVATEVVANMGIDGLENASVPARMLRDVRVTTIYEGTSEIQRLVMGRHILGALK
jgi:butyryl-CoA dehydrogenase